jgi:2-polyprenyl-3-methyl-5-hydroxy-6-metoxy-1,4-benzoquinol methylase
MTKTESSCRFCGSGSLVEWTAKPVPYVKCTDCNFISVSQLPSKEELDFHYSKYHDLNHQASITKNQLRAKSYKQESLWLVDKIQNLSKVDPKDSFRTFDFGGSGGYFLDCFSSILSQEMPDINLEFSCCDKSEPAIEILRDKGYYIAEEEAFSNLDYYDLVIVRGVIEHIPNFKQIVQYLSRIVRSSGFVFITATPNGSSAAATLYRSGWVQHHYPSHIQHFSESHFDILFSLENFIRCSFDDLYFNSPYANPSLDLKRFRQSAETMQGNSEMLGDDSTRHAFPGSMLTLLYKKIL